MTLKFKVPNDDFTSLADNVQALYTSNDDGNHYLQVEGAVAKERVDEFRNNNIELKRQLDTYKDVNIETYNGFMSLGVDAADIPGLKETQGKIRDKQLFDNKDIDGLVAAQVNDRVGVMKSEHETAMSALTGKLSTAQGQLEEVLVSNDLRTAATEAGVLPEAMDDILLRGRQVFKLQDGASTPFDSKAQIMYGADGVKPLTTKEWATGLKQSAPHLFTQPKGAGIIQGVKGFGADTSKMSSIDKISAGLGG